MLNARQQKIFNEIKARRDERRRLAEQQRLQNEAAMKSVEEFYRRLDATGICRMPLPAMSNADEEENWITVNGARVKIEKGQSKEEAAKGFIREKEAEREAKPIAVTFSANGANPSIPAFTQKSLDDHWGGKSDHSGEYPGFTKEQYAERALELVRMPASENILGYKAANGSIVRYDKTTNDFVKGFNTGVASMFKPTGGKEYFKRQLRYDGGVTHD